MAYRPADEGPSTNVEEIACACIGARASSSGRVLAKKTESTATPLECKAESNGSITRPKHGVFGFRAFLSPRKRRFDSLSGSSGLRRLPFLAGFLQRNHEHLTRPPKIRPPKATRILRFSILCYHSSPRAIFVGQLTGLPQRW